LQNKTTDLGNQHGCRIYFAKAQSNGESNANLMRFGFLGAPHY
jgi:hypothetical protein